MTNQLMPFLQEIVGRVMPFATTIDFIHVKELEDGRLMAKASGMDGSAHLTATSKHTINLGGARMCLGNLMYLNQVLNSDMLKTNRATVSVNSTERNEKLIVRSLQFTPNNRMEINYITTDPFRASIVKPMQITIEKWPVEFIVDDSAFKEIIGFKKIHAAAPSVGNEDVLQVSYTNDEMVIDFGEGGTQKSTLYLDTAITATSKRSFGVYLLADQFIRGLTQSQDDDNLSDVYMADKAIKFMSDTSIAEHELVLVGRKMRDE